MPHLPRVRRLRRGLPPALALVLLAGGIATAGGSARQRDPESDRLSLSMAEPRMSVSGDHRIGEFVVAADPRDPKHLVAAGYDLDSSNGPSFCTAFVTTDGAQTWQAVELVPGEEGGWGGDPWVTIAPNGDVHLTCLTVSIVNGSWLYDFTSADGGFTWSAAGKLEGLVDKESVFASRKGHWFACGSHVTDTGSSLAVIRSVDRGKTWGKPTFFEGLKNCNGIVEGPGGQLYLNWLAIVGETRVVGTVASLDGGRTWQKPTIVATHPYPNEYTNPETTTSGPNTYTRPTDTWPNIAVSPRTGSVFVADSREDVETASTGVKLRISRDKGASYRLVALPMIPTALTDPTFTRPAVAVDAKGRLALQVTANGGTAFSERETWLLVSPDDGRTWLAPVLVGSTDATHSHLDPRAHAPNTNTIPNTVIYTIEHPTYVDATFAMSATLLANSAQLEWGGDYWAITSTKDGFVAMWEDFAEGGENRLYSRVVTVTPAG